MSYPSVINALPADPADLSPESLREFYENMRAALLEIVAELGSDPGGVSTAAARLVTLEAQNLVITHTTQTANYTLALADAGTIVEMNNASARTITVPPNASVAFPVDTVIEACRYGSGTLTIVAGAGVTLVSPGGLLAARAQYSAISMRKRATNEWLLGGDLV